MSLKREEAVVRHELLSVESYDVDLDLTKGAEIFGSTAKIRFECRTPGSDTFVEVAPHTLTSATLNGRTLPVASLADGRLPLSDLQSHNELVITADMAYSHDGEGLHRFTDPEDGLTYTYMMGFLDMAPRVFACFDQPDLKAPYRLCVTAPPDWTVVANEAGTRSGDGRWEFVESKPMATYFVTVVAGPYHSLYREHDGVRFGLHARQSYRGALDQDSEELFTVTFGCWDRLNALYGIRYPFGQTYDQCFVPEFNAGAMENPGCVTFRDEAYLFRQASTEAEREYRVGTISHEMAHMWFGDLVTMRWWDDLWLNESFASFMGDRAAVEGAGLPTVRANSVISRSHAYHADQLPSTHPVSGDIPDAGAALSNFDRISYQKGEAVLDQLAASLGDEVFFAGLRDYFERFRFSNASLPDLMECLGKASGRDLGDWSHQWLRTSGPNTLRLRTEIADGRYTDVVIEQSAPDESPTLRPHHVRIGVYRPGPDGLTRTDQVAVDLSEARTPVPRLVGVEAAPLLLLNDEALTYAQIRLDEHSFANLRESMATLTDDLARALLWTLMIGMVGDGELSVAEYLDLLSDTIPHEHRSDPLRGQLDFARDVVDRFVAPDHHPAMAARLARIARGVRQRAEPGGGIQLTALRAEIAAASDIEWLRGLLAGAEHVEGVELDSDLRWRVLLRLTVLGETEGVDIEAELERDPSSEGHKHAATCRAAVPSAAAKAATWASLLNGQGLSNHQLVALVRGFWWPEHTHLTGDYVERYFTEALDNLNTRAPSEQISLARQLFPRYAVAEATIARAQTAAADERLDPLLRRVLVDKGAELRQARRARQRG